MKICGHGAQPSYKGRCVVCYIENLESIVDTIRADGKRRDALVVSQINEIAYLTKGILHLGNIFNVGITEAKAIQDGSLPSSIPPET